MNYPALMFWFNAVHAIFTLCLAFFAWRVAKQKATESRFRKLEAEMAERATKKDLVSLRCEIEDGCELHQRRVAAMELATARMPTQVQIDSLQKSIVDLSGALSNTQGRLEGVNRAVDLINEFLINQGGAKK